MVTKWLLCLAVLKLSVARQQVLRHETAVQSGPCSDFKRPGGYAQNEVECRARNNKCGMCPQGQADARNRENRCVAKQAHCITKRPTRPAENPTNVQNPCGQNQRATSQWMGEHIAPDTPFWQLTLPGTHDAAMSDTQMKFTNIARCQSLSLVQQACAGVRVFDLRVKWDGGKFEFLHPGWVTIGGHGDGWITSPSAMDFATALPALTRYLLTHSDTEVLILRFKAEGLKTPSQARELAFRIERFFGEFAVLQTREKGANIGTYNLDELQSARSIRGAPGARVVLMNYKWDPQIQNGGDYGRYPADRRRTWWLYGDNVVGKFSNAAKVAPMLTATNSRKPMGINNGQWRNLKKYHASGGSKRGKRLLAFYLTLTQTKGSANVYENTRSQFGARGKWDSLLNDLARIAIVNFQGFANFLMVDFYGNPLWNNQRLTARAENDQGLQIITGNPILDLCILLSKGQGNRLSLSNAKPGRSRVRRGLAKQLPVLSGMKRS